MSTSFVVAWTEWGDTLSCNRLTPLVNIPFRLFWMTRFNLFEVNNTFLSLLYNLVAETHPILDPFGLKRWLPFIGPNLFRVGYLKLRRSIDYYLEFSIEPKCHLRSLLIQESSQLFLKLWQNWPISTRSDAFPLKQKTRHWWQLVILTCFYHLHKLCQILSFYYVYTITTNQSTVNISGRMTFMNKISDDTANFTLCIINNIGLKPVAQSSNTFI